ncbi:HAD family hydrolase [Acetonema longum]|uniref:Haloacid dehalogenase-like hydrolase n=1 Tax=Acetonema longum DSM 6540 TaxID=1009370 RepID=F7NDJ4_9FIRM|nr:HAD family hydrolase [Acetonema longum]EGO65856.1 haloacid dehalogenase-like hydrolase [Acetonema longum DSM 6540]
MYDVILFDLDGTLTDPKPGITRSVQYALAKFDIHVADLDSLIPFIGPPLSESFQVFYRLSEADAKKAVEYYREYFTEKGLYENAVFDGIPELLANLKQAGKTLIVATSKPTVFAEKILQHFQLAHYFSRIAGSNLDGTRVDKDEVIAFALMECLDIPKGRIIMVGDRKHDVIGARKNGICCIAAAFGYGSPEELREANPKAMAASVQDLLPMLMAE